MIYTDLLLAALIIATSYFIGRRWARADKEEIDRRNASHNYTGLNHNALLAWRITVLVIGLVLCWAWLKWTGSTLWLLIPCALLAWGVFTATHRYRLNTLRGFHARYMAPWGNVYDRVIMSMVLMSEGYGITRIFLDTIKTDYAAGKKAAHTIIHAGGKLAYRFELSIASAAFIWFILESIKW